MLPPKPCETSHRHPIALAGLMTLYRWRSSDYLLGRRRSDWVIPTSLAPEVPSSSNEEERPPRTSAAFWVAVGSADRSRPYAYPAAVAMNSRLLHRRHLLANWVSWVLVEAVLPVLCV